MALADTDFAIGAVTHLLEEKLHNKTELDITVGRPGENQGSSNSERLNLFLYEASFDPTMKNFSLDENQPAPLWLVLKYIITAFDDGGDSDTRVAHQYLGKGIKALQDLTLLQLNNTVPLSIRKALKDNPEDLKISFDEVNSDLLSRVMQGTDEKYRFSLGFQVRPILVAPTPTPAFNLLVGIDYEADEVIGDNGIQLDTTVADSPTIEMIAPQKFEATDSVKISGTNLNIAGLKALINDQEMTIENVIDANAMMVNGSSLVAAHSLSAGEWQIQISQPLPSGRYRKSNSVIGKLLPQLTAAPTYAVVGDGGRFTLTGKLLGNENDAIALALYKDGVVTHYYDDLTGTTNQDKVIVDVTNKNKPASGTYRVIVIVNGQQAKQSPEVTIS